MRSAGGRVREDVIGLASIAAALAFFVVSGETSYDMLKGYNATLRMVDGQLPYRDFFPQVIPLSNVLAVPVFATLPTIGSAALALAIVLNVTATLLMHRLLLGLTRQRGSALVAGLLTAVWYCQLGGYYYDQVAYLFALAAFVRYEARPAGAGAGVVEGLLLACAPLAKQSVGSVTAAAFVATVIAFYGYRPLLRTRFVAGLLAPVMVLCLYLAAIDGWQAFSTYAIAQQADYAAREVNLWRLATDFMRPWNLDIVEIVRDRRFGQLAFYPLVLAVYVSYLGVALRLRQGRIERRIVAGYVFLLLSTVWAAALPGRSYAHVTFGFAGVVALAGVALLPDGTSRAALRRWAQAGAAALFAGIGLVLGTLNLYPDGREASPLSRGNLWPLTFDRQHREAIAAVAAMDLEGKTYGLFVDTFNAVPLALGRAPLDPMLFYEERSMVPDDDGRRRAWEATVIAHLEARRPDVLILGYAQPAEPRHGRQDGSGDRLPELFLANCPALEAYVEAAYSQVIQRAGPLTLRVRTRRS